ncbi:hypothetical protein C8R45DRAFT_188827 [Mycena sanguinolenta]|nr:hypothetical protein C8R45DRAFT_188827 [Mycena sanguinolenta]
MTSEIFLHCLPDLQHAVPIFFRSSEIPIPLLLSQICRAWRHIALNTPQIWAIFRIDVHAWLTDRARVALHLAKWLERAGLSPLSFVYSARSAAIVPPILALAHQWQNVCLRRLSHTDLVAHRFKSSLHARLPNLETLEISTDVTNIPGNSVVTAFELAPRLRHVDLEYLPPTMILLPWNQLTHFRGWGLDDMQCVHVLRLAVSLVECRFDYVRGQGNVNPTVPLPIHPALKILHFRGHHVSSSILGLATFPSLVELDYRDGETSEPYESFIGFLSRSRAPLLRLFLLGRSYLRILHGFPYLLDLVDLEISGLAVAGMSDFLQNLAVRDPASFLPRLESLTCSVREEDFETEGLDHDPSDVNWDGLADALEFRFRWNRPGPLPRLKSFRMTWMTDGELNEDSDNDNELLSPPSGFDHNLPRLRCLIQEGMHISMMAKGEDLEGETVLAVWI